MSDELEHAVREIEAHVAQSGWDQPARLFALVPTGELLEREPGLAESLGEAAQRDGLTPIEQELAADEPLETLLERIIWPDQVAGCAAVVERLVLPPEADGAVPEDPAEAERFAREHPDRQEVRLVAGAVRDGSAYCALRLRSHDENESVATGTDLVPALVDLVRATLEDE